VLADDTEVIGEEKAPFASSGHQEGELAQR
jgi:hypothetical protein